MTIYLLPTQGPKYRGKYPRRLRSWSYGKSKGQEAVANYLGIEKPTHFELNCGWRYIADSRDLNRDLVKVGAELSEIIRKNAAIQPLSQPQYDEMLDLVRQARSL